MKSTFAFFSFGLFIFLSSIAAIASGVIVHHIGTASYTNLNSVSLDGTNEYIDAGNLAITTNMTVLVWVKQSASTSSLTIASKWEASDSERSFVIQAQDTNASMVQYLLSGNGTTVHKNYRAGSTCLSTSGWNLVGFTFAGGSDTLLTYCNGVLDGSPTKVTDSSLGGSIFSSTAKFMLGAVSKNAGGAIGGPFNGKLDSATVWDKVLSATEILDIYNSADPGDPRNHSASANLKNWWPIGEFSDSNTLFEDQVGANDGTGTNIESGDIQTDIP